MEGNKGSVVGFMAGIVMAVALMVSGCGSGPRNTYAENEIAAALDNCYTLADSPFFPWRSKDLPKGILVDRSGVWIYLATPGENPDYAPRRGPDYELRKYLDDLSCAVTRTAWDVITKYPDGDQRCIYVNFYSIGKWGSTDLAWSSRYPNESRPKFIWKNI